VKGDHCSDGQILNKISMPNHKSANSISQVAVKSRIDYWLISIYTTIGNNQYENNLYEIVTPLLEWNWWPIQRCKIEIRSQCVH